MDFVVMLIMNIIRLDAIGPIILRTSITDPFGYNEIGFSIFLDAEIMRE